MIEALEEHSTARSSKDTEQEIDPRWEALSKLRVESEE